jgi:hypothetical protein
MKATRTFWLMAGVLIAHMTSAQRFDIKGVELDGERLNIYYDLIDPNSTNTYTISVFSSRDNFISAVSKVSGDQGLEVHPGINKKIVWNAKEELGPDFEGKVSLEVRGRIYIPFIKLEGLQKSFKRGKATHVSWTGGSSQAVLSFELYNGEEKIESYPPVPNVKNYEFTVSTSVKPGSGYYFRISDSKNKDDVVLSPRFSVSRKVPLALKAAGVAVVGGVFYMLLGTGGSTSKDIPNPLSPDSITN